MKPVMAFLVTLYLALPARGAACRVIDEGRIRGRDLAAAFPAFAGLDADSDIAPAPLAGVERVFHPEELAKIAREHSIAPPLLPAETCFVRKTVTLSSERLLPALVQALALPSSRMEILDFSRYPVPEGKLEFPRGALAASGLWQGRVIASDGRTTSVWARVRVTDPASGAAVPLVPSAAPREVNRGDTVRVEVRSGRVTLVFDSTAESSGRKGEMVLVSNPEKTRRLLARVEDKGKVSINK